MTLQPPVTPTDRLFEADAYATTATATVVEAGPAGVVLDRTLFYAESGGQPGDRGRLTLPDGTALTVTDTRYRPGRLRIAHVLARPEAAPPPGTPVTLEVDWALRYRHMRMHTALHVLCGLLDAPVTGCAIHADRGRLDLDLPDSPGGREAVDERFQAVVAAAEPVSHAWRSGEAVARALADRRTVKPPPATTERLRVVSVGQLDLQPCGGTHVRKTGELAGLRVERIQKKSRHSRRVTVVDAHSGGGHPRNGITSGRPA